MIKLLVKRLTVDGVDISGEEQPSALEIEAGGDARPSGPLRYNIRAALVNNGIVVTGKASAKFECRCGRCAASFAMDVANEEVCHFYEGVDQVELDLTEDIREDILINLPYYLVCSEDCKGLCFKCGKNLNEGACDCVGDKPSAAPWSELDKLKL